MGFRQRFKKDEISAFVIDADIEWQNGTHWHPGKVVKPPAKTDLGLWNVGIVHTGRKTATISPGQYVQCSPGKVRLRGAA